MAQAFQANVSEAHHEAMDAYIHHRPHAVCGSFLVPDSHPATAACSLFYRQVFFQAGTRTSQAIDRHLSQGQVFQTSMAQALQAHVSGVHHKAIDTTGPMSSVDHSLFVPDRPPATAAFSACRQVFFQEGTWASQPVDRLLF